MTSARILTMTVVAGLAACSTPDRPDAADAEPAADAQMIADGRRIARLECGACHAVGETGVSPHPDAPPLRTVLADYNPHALEMDLAEGIRVGHSDMPLFELSPIGVRALTAYLESIQVEDE